MAYYEYKVVSFETKVTAADVRKGVAGAKVTAQVELQLSTISKSGWEFYNHFPVDVGIKKGCLGIFDTKSPSAVTIIVLVFRREMR
ncbi:MAG TPA: hypothetical protein VFC78_03900 [Tepidisphaeraceae bacterium]|nr:hypothetical protein [Tepidisphaeraceae bacterium]